MVRFFGTAFFAALLVGAALCPARADEPGTGVMPAPQFNLVAPDTRSDARDFQVSDSSASTADLKMWLGASAKQAKNGSIKRFARGIINRTSTLAAGLTRSAMRFIGTPYVFGGTSPSGFDCSGYTQHVFAMVGIKIPRTADVQFYAGHRIKNGMRAGDLVFFQTYEPGPSHVGIYLGDGKFVHSSSHGVMVSKLKDNYWASRYLGAKRLTAN